MRWNAVVLIPLRRLIGSISVAFPGDSSTLLQSCITYRQIEGQIDHHTTVVVSVCKRSQADKLVDETSPTNLTDKLVKLILNHSFCQVQMVVR